MQALIKKGQEHERELDVRSAVHCYEVQYLLISCPCSQPRSWNSSHCMIHMRFSLLPYSNWTPQTLHKGASWCQS